MLPRGLPRFRFARQPQGFQPLAIGIEGAPGFLMLFHGELCIGLALKVPLLALFGGEGFGGYAIGMFVHGRNNARTRE
jgi:hypothetical protein